jgi:flavin-dependent dehydrogenase
VNTFDLIIIGAGPAGCAAALTARRKNLRVLMLDKSPRPKAAPGETLHPGVEVILEQLGVAEALTQAGFLRHAGIWVNNGDTRRFVAYGSDAADKWHGIQANRQRLHEILRSAVLESGTILLTGERPARLSLAKNSVVGVELVGGEIFHSRWTIDATGRTAWLARQLGIAAELRSPLLRARYGWQSLVPGAGKDPEFTYRDNGWDWRAPLANERLAWVELRAAKAPDEHRSGVDLTWRIRAQCAGPGYFLTGDAAAVLDPASSHGVLRALMSGIFCSHLAIGCAANKISENDAAETYRTWMIDKYSHDEKQMLKLYRESPLGQYFGAFHAFSGK